MQQYLPLVLRSLLFLQAHRRSCAPRAAQFGSLGRFFDAFRPGCWRHWLALLARFNRFEELETELFDQSVVIVCIFSSCGWAGRLIFVEVLHCTVVSLTYPMVIVRNIRLASRSTASTIWSLRRSSLFLRFGWRRGFPSLPRRTLPLGCSSTLPPSNRFHAASVRWTLRVVASGPKSTSCSLPIPAARR